MHRLLQDTAGTLEFKHDTGKLSQVNISIAGMGIRKVRKANLPPEVPDRTIRDNLAKYGEVKDIIEELWTKAYRYKVSNGIRIVEMNLKLHLPSYMIMAGHWVLVSYDGQPSTCYACNESGHQYQDCPNRKLTVPPEKIPSNSTWADVVMQNTRNTRPAMLQRATETLLDTSPEGTQTTVNMPPVMEQTTQSRCAQGQPNIAEVNLTPVDNNTTEQSNKYSDDMLIDTTDHPITKDDMKHTSIQAQEILPTTVPDKRENYIVREKREPHKHRHEDRTDWAKTLPSLTDDEIQLPTPTETTKRSKKPRTERELPTHRERTRSKTRQATPKKL
jgi:hypothetical protein